MIQICDKEGENLKLDPIVIGENYILPGDDIGIERINDNVLVESPSGGGKTTSIVFPTIARMSEMNLIAEYAKEEEAFQHAGIMRRKGYTVEFLNVKNPENSTVSFDPIPSIKGYTDVEALADTIVMSTMGGSKEQPYWTLKGKSLCCSLILSSIMAVDDAGIEDMLKAFDKTVPTEGFAAGFTTEYDSEMDEIIKAAPDSCAAREYRAWRSLPYRTASCVRDTLAGAIANVFTESIRGLLRNTPQVDYHKLCSEKSALFIISDVSAPAQAYYTNLFWNVTIRQLRRIADRSTEHRLPRLIRLIFGDFGCTSPIINFEKDISVFRSAGISALVILQSQSQLESVYGANKAAIIRQNCPVQVYLSGGMDEKSCALVSRRMNLPIEEVMYAKIGRVFVMQSGRKPVIVNRYDTFHSREYLESLDFQGKSSSHRNS